MYTKKQQEIIDYARNKIISYMGESPVAGHDANHAIRVADWAIKIAKKEKGNIFLCELGGLLHDVGRVLEYMDTDNGFKIRHHELSYEICQDWFKNDEILSQLSKPEKLNL